MTPDEHDRLTDVLRRIRALEREMLDLSGLPGAVARIEGALDTLTQLVGEKMSHMQETAERTNSLRSAVTFAGVVIVPIIVALLGGYFLLRAGAKAK